MQIIQRALFGSFCAVAIAAAPVLGQDYNGAAGYGGAYADFGSFTDSGTELALSAGPLATAFGERWYGSGRVGFRVNGAITSRPLELSGADRDIRTWMLDGNLMLRLLPAIAGRSAAPFLSAGAGVVHYNLGTGDPLVVASEARYPGDAENRFAIVGGAGLDIMPAELVVFGTPIGIRLEVADHIVLDSPFESTGGESFGPVHNLRFGASLIGLIDLMW